MKNKFLFLIFSTIVIINSANAFELCGNIKQGEFVIGKAKGAANVNLNGDDLLLSNDGYFLLAFGRDEKNTQKLQITANEDFNYSFDVGETKWDVQNIKGVPPRKVTPSDSDLAAIELERKVVRASLRGLKDNTAWLSGFIIPVEGRISGKFGGQRIMNNVPKSPHQGMDIAAKEGTKIKASADGEIVLAYPDLFYSGNVVVIDHGYGLQTIYAHMKDMSVKVGQKVSQGDIIGTVGKTGRATGPHLHWGASLRNVRFNPQSLIDMDKNQLKCLKL
ncbi:MAG: M23 family metallopeptidase [Alphaproteobacteria bacterium]|nr:M23 family metallopeptidase [Alphaproteobacteria bacterium]